MDKTYENLLQTKEQQFKQRKWDRMFVSRSLITSKAFLSLKTAAACQVTLIFLNKCKWEKVQGKTAKRKAPYFLANQGKIQFSYKEAKQKYGMSSGKFTRAIDEVVENGLIDIAKSGLGLHKDVTLYAISDRWLKFGTDEFVIQKRPKREQQFGFTNKNKLGRNCKKQNKINVYG
jgi:hypothetical protein